MLVLIFKPLKKVISKNRALFNFNDAFSFYLFSLITVENISKSFNGKSPWNSPVDFFKCAWVNKFYDLTVHFFTRHQIS